MARNLTASVVTELTASSVAPIFLVEIALASATIRLWTGNRELTWNSETWYGNGWLHGFGGATEVSEVEAVGCDIELAGVPQSVLSAVLNEANQGLSGKIWLGFLDDSEAVIADPYLLFEGKYDLATIVEDPEEPRVTISYESLLIELERTREFRYTTETQNQFSYGANDTGFRYNDAANEWSGFWGNEKNKPKKKKKNKKKKKR